ncbi:hypothetical protein GCM10022235_75200 [Kribbella ginsengisoli]|uniref:LPXTG cell wall anchor domain-containing protein n=2 Tax=Kribbella ginsengisoli TaxID=363865 RepID=A0ABP6YWB1_9ACTN
MVWDPQPVPDHPRSAVHKFQPLRDAQGFSQVDRGNRISMATDIASPESHARRSRLLDWGALLAAIAVVMISGSSLASATVLLADSNSADTAAVVIGTSASAASASPLPGGDVDGDANDWTGTPLIFLAVLAVLLVVVGGIILARYRSHRSQQADQHRK